MVISKLTFGASIDNCNMCLLEVHIILHFVEEKKKNGNENIWSPPSLICYSRTLQTYSSVLLVKHYADFLT